MFSVAHRCSLRCSRPPNGHGVLRALIDIGFLGATAVVWSLAHLCASLVLARHAQTLFSLDDRALICME